jgi:hypothetical protein
MEPQIKAPRVTPLEGVSTHGAAMRVRGVENPQGFCIDERRFIVIVSPENESIQSPQRTLRAQSIDTIIFASFALFAVRFVCHLTIFEASGGI